MSAVVALAHSAALGYDFYRDLAWFDLLTHFLGGAVIGSGFLWATYSLYPGYEDINKKRVYFDIIVVTLVIGIGWEFFEIFINTPRDSNYPLDTTIDLIMDVLGALAIALLARP